MVQTNIKTRLTLPKSPRNTRQKARHEWKCANDERYEEALHTQIHPERTRSKRNGCGRTIHQRKNRTCGKRPMVQTPRKRKPGTKRRTETEPEIWTVQENCQNSTGTDQKHSRRHGPRRKGRGIRRHIRRKFYRHNGHTQNFLSDHDRFKDEIYAHLHFIVIKTVTGNKTVETKVLLDTGAEGLFMDRNYAEEHNIVLQKLPNL